METCIYISGAITGIENYKADFDKVQRALTFQGQKIVNPAHLDSVIINGDYEEYMKICFELMKLCDVVVLLPGWERSAGANRELGYALGSRKKVYVWDENAEVIREYE